MPKLTKTTIANAALKAKPYFLFDSQLSGFCVRISPKGKRRYYIQYMHHKITKRLSIGDFTTMAPEQARQHATILLGQIKNGADPSAERQRQRQAPLVQELAERYMAEHVMAHCKPSTQKGYRRYLDKHILPFLGMMKVADVTRADIAAFHHSLRHIPYEANRCLEVISKMFNLAEVWSLRPDHSNPRRHIKKYPMQKRERYLNEDEVTRLGIVLQQLKHCHDENLAAVFCVQLLLLTGCRLGEIQTLKWDYVDLKQKMLRLPDSKTGAKMVYIGDAVCALLQEIKAHPARPQDNPYVIWGRERGKHLNNMQKPWRRFRKLAKLDDARLHDLRHSFASFAINDGMSLAMIGRLLGHTQVQTTARYAHLMAKPMVKAASTVANQLGGLLAIDTPNTPPEKPTTASYLLGTTITPPTFLTAQQAAQYLNVKPRLLENWRWRGKGPQFTKVGNRIRYRVEDLDCFITGQ